MESGKGCAWTFEDLVWKEKDTHGVEEGFFGFARAAVPYPGSSLAARTLNQEFRLLLVRTCCFIALL